MIVKAELTYADGSSAVFTGEPVDLSTLPTQSPDENTAPAVEEVAAPDTTTPEGQDSPVEAAPVEETAPETVPVEPEQA